MENPLDGYRGSARALLEGLGARPGDELELELVDGFRVRGHLMPRYEHADDEHITLKLKNGYNTGFAISKVARVDIVSTAGHEERAPEPRSSSRAQAQRSGDVLVLGTGGTIASRIDYRTGAVTPVFTSEDLYSRIPGLGGIAKLDTETLFNILSENMTPEHWSAIASKIGEAVRDGYKGIVITHGTDTMHYTAAALSFALDGLPLPVVLVGAQRSSDRPSSDAPTNMMAAVLAASKGDFSGVYVAMHAGLSDDSVALHMGVKVRKNHTSRRDAFQSINSKPAALVDPVGGEIRKVLGLPPRGVASSLKVKASFDGRAFLLKSFPGIGGDIVDYLVDRGYRAIILEGTGLGHVGRQMHEGVRRAIERGVFVGMTSQCIWGRVRMTVYDTGRDLLKMGVVPLGDMLSEVALVKAMWLLGQGASYDDMRAMMPTNMRGEISGRSLLRYDVP